MANSSSDQSRIYSLLLESTTTDMADSYYDYDRRIPGCCYDPDQDRFFSLNCSDVPPDYAISLKTHQLTLSMRGFSPARLSVNDLLTRREYNINSNYNVMQNIQIKKTISGLRSLGAPFQTFLSPSGDLFVQFSSHYLFFYLVDQHVELVPFPPVDFAQFGGVIVDVGFFEGTITDSSSPHYSVAILTRNEIVIYVLDKSYVIVIDSSIFLLKEVARSMSIIGDNHPNLAFADFDSLTVFNRENQRFELKFSLGASGVCFRNANLLHGVRAVDHSAVNYDLREPRPRKYRLRGLSKSVHYQLECVGDYHLLCGCDTQLGLLDVRFTKDFVTTYKGHECVSSKVAVFEYNRDLGLVTSVDGYGYIRLWELGGGSSFSVIVPDSVGSHCNVHLRNVFGGVRQVPKLCVLKKNDCIYYSL